MRLRVDFSDPEDKPGYYLNLILAKVIIEAVEDRIYRIPDHWIAGRNRMRLTLSDLSPAEIDKLYPMLEAEIPGGFIRRVSKVKSRKEHDNSGYLFSPPGYIEGEEENLSRRIDKQLNIEKTLQAIIEVTSSVISEESKTPEPTETPITIKALREYSHYCNVRKILDGLSKGPETVTGTKIGDLELIEHLKPIEHLTIAPRKKY